MSNGLVGRSLSKLRAIVTKAAGIGALPTAKRLAQVRQQLNECAQAQGGEVSSRQRAALLALVYLDMDDAERCAVLRMLAEEFGPDAAKVDQANAQYQASIASPAQWEAEAQLRAVMRSRRLRILTQFNAIPQGVKFLVDLRADLLRYMKDNLSLQALDRELSHRLTVWFDVGFLELSCLSWQSPAALLEKIVAYEAVHEIHSWSDLKNRLDSDRRCYAFFHPRMPLEPLIFVEVALLEGLADNVQSLLDERAPLQDAERASTAIFYSISNTQAGLRGISFGNFLLKRVIDDLKRDLPRLKIFATLSPLPGLVRWYHRQPQVFLEACTGGDWKRLNACGISGPEDPTWQTYLAQPQRWDEQEGLVVALKSPLIRLAARFLLEARHRGLPADPVARFHLGNGARVERLNWQADTSTKGLQQSWGIMVNYLYEPDLLEANVEAYANNAAIKASSSIRRLAGR